MFMTENLIEMRCAAVYICGNAQSIIMSSLTVVSFLNIQLLIQTVFLSLNTKSPSFFCAKTVKMCVEVFATYICSHTVPMWIPCSTFALAGCPKYQRQYRNRPLRCSCTCTAPVSLAEALQDNTFGDTLYYQSCSSARSSVSSSPGSRS